MDYASNYQTAVIGSLQGLYDKVAAFTPNLVAAIIVLILGWVIGVSLSRLVQRVLVAVRLDSLANQVGLHHLSERTGRHLSLSAFGAWLIKWFFFLVTIIAAANILGLSQVTTFLYDQVFPYAGNVIVAMIILLLGVLGANFLSGIVASSLKASGLTASGALATLTRWAVVIFSILAALSQLKIASSFLQDLFRAVIAMLSIAGGLAFGLGGKDHARKVLDKLEEGLTKRV